MSSENLSRRAILAGVAAVTVATPGALALASPSATPPSASPLTAPAISDDPIFAAIDDHRQLNARYLTTLRELDELEERLPEEITRDPHVALYPELDGKAEITERSADHIIIRHETGSPTGKMHWAKSHAEITAAAQNIPGEHRAAWLADRHAALKADERATRKARKAAGLTRLQNRSRVSGNAAYEAGQALIAMRPATIAGTLALVAYAIESRERDESGFMCDEDDPYILLNSVAQALASQVPDEIARSIPDTTEAVRS